MLFALRRVLCVLAAVVMINGLTLVGLASPAGALTATSTNPAAGSTVKPPAQIRANYDAQLQSSSTISLKNGNGLALAGTKSIDNGLTTGSVVFTPASTLTEAGNPYTVTVHANSLLDSHDLVFTFSVDTTAPIAPTIETVTNPVNASNKTMAVVTGEATPGDTVVITIDDQGNGATTPATKSVLAGEDGTYQATVDVSALADGTLDVTAMAKDAAGNVSPADTDQTTKDATVPTATTITIADDPVNQDNQTTVTITGTAGEPDLTIDVAVTDEVGSPSVVGSTTTLVDGTWTLDMDLTSLVEGEITATATATDTAGNVSVTSSDTALKELGSPMLVSTTPEASTSVNSAPEVTATYNEPLGTASTITVADNSGVTLAGTRTFRDNGRTIVFTPPSPLPEAGSDYTVTVNARDAAGNATAEVIYTFTVDATAPVLVSTTPADGDEAQTVPEVSATYDEDLASDSTITVTDGLGAGVDGTTSFTDATIVFTPTAALSEAGSPYTVTVNGLDAAGNAATETTFTFTIDTTIDYQPLTPARILDTRDTTPLGAGETRTIDVTDVGGVPDTGVGAVVVNVTAVNGTSNTFLTVYPTGAAQPATSSMNPRAGQILGNEIIAKVGDDGTVQLYNQRGDIDVIFDVVGWMPDTADYVPLTPARILDTRDTTPLGAGETRTIDVTDVGGVPDTGVGAVVVNLTAFNGTTNTYLTVYPTGATQPITSSMNPRAGQIAGNEIIAKVGDDGTVQIFNNRGDIDVVLDVVGWMPDTADYQPLTPARILDTRDTTPLGAGETRTVDVTDVGGVPDTGVGAVVVNVTAFNGTANTFLAVYPTGANQPTASSLNPRTGQIAGNEIIAKVGDDGTVQIFNNRGDVDVIFDVVGWMPDSP